MFWLYGGKLRGRCGEFVECRTGGLGGTTEKVFGRGGGAGACRRWEKREDVSSGRGTAGVMCGDSYAGGSAAH